MEKYKDHMELGKGKEEKGNSEKVKRNKKAYKKFLLWFIVFLFGLAFGFGVKNLQEPREINTRLPIINKTPLNVEMTKEPVYLNEDSFYGDFTLNLKEVSETKSIDGVENGGLPIATNEKFIVIKFTITNKSHKIKKFEGFHLELRTLGTKTAYYCQYKATYNLNKLEISNPNNIDWLDEKDNFIPKSTKVTYVAFEVPSDFNRDDCEFLYGDEESEERVSSYLVQRPQ